MARPERNYLLLRVDYGHILTDVSPGPNRNFNTTNIKPDNVELKPFSKKPYSLDRWLPFILETRGQEVSLVQRVDLKPREVAILIQSYVPHPSGYVKASKVDELQNIVLAAFKGFRKISEGYFLRLNNVIDTPKYKGDSVHPTRHLVTTKNETILRLLSSRTNMDHLRQSLRQGKSVPITFIPFDNRIKRDRQYRVFCAPGTGRITAISQYAWYRRWNFAFLPAEHGAAIVDEIYEGIVDLHRDIIEELVISDKNDRLFIQQGFSFDVFFDESSGDMGIVEINEFGAGSDCSSCLFNWAEDFHLLYGECNQVQFRIVLPNNAPLASSVIKVPL